MRLASGRHIDSGKVGGTAFILRNNEIDGLSVNMPGVLAENIHVGLEELRQILASRMTVRKSARFAEFTIQSVIAKLLDAQLAWDVGCIPDPLPADGSKLANASHCLIVGLPKGETPEAEMVGDLIAAVVNALHWAMPGDKHDLAV